MPTRYAFLILRTDDATAPDRRVMSRGQSTLAEGQTPAEFAGKLLRENRSTRSHYTGPRRCSVWPIDGDGPIPRIAPDAALHFDD
ncbi:hypothetical protein ACFWIK_00800 [Streptomyces anthocyanicus]|uniref:hypothetical protein n=1 Tax=Streptomyces anthocyanicus TaxID=68174 RepID=UPI003650D908